MKLLMANFGIFRNLATLTALILQMRAHRKQDPVWLDIFSCFNMKQLTYKFCSIWPIFNLQKKEEEVLMKVNIYYLFN